MGTYKGRCFCGEVEVEVTGEPVAMGYCHCASCRAWSAGPVNAFTLWKPDAVKITHGRDHLGVFHKTDRSEREFCTVCGGHVMTEHPGFQLIDVYAATIPSLAFRPALHINYGEAVLPIHDGLPKYRDIPAEMGGTGATLPE